MDKRIPAAAIRRVWLDDAMTQTEAAALIGLSRVSLWIRAKALGLPARKEGRRPVIPDAELAVLWRACVKSTAIAGLYGCPEGSVRQASRRLGLARRPIAKHRVLSLDEYRLELLRRSQVPGGQLSDVERSVLARIAQA